MLNGHIGDDEHPSSVGDIDVGGPVVSVTAGMFHICALLEGGSVRCWGVPNYGALGYGYDTDIVGDDETPASLGDVDVGGPAIAIEAGTRRTCALLEGGTVRCWGECGNAEGIEYEEWDTGGPLGYANLETIGDDETPASAGDIDIGGVVVGLAVGGEHMCALLEGGTVRCWGNAKDFGGSNPGRLGYGNLEDIGDDETPASAGDVDVGAPVVALSAGSVHTCALVVGGAVRCWGSGYRLGYGNTDDIGDDETPASAGDVPLGGAAISIEVGDFHTCALMENGGVRCWGISPSGQLGYGNQDPVGWTNTPADVGDIDLGGVAIELATGAGHTCALLEGGAIRCWGSTGYGKLGYAMIEHVGDDETPASVGDVQVD